MPFKLTQQELLLIASALIFKHNSDSALPADRKDAIYALGQKINNRIIELELNDAGVGISTAVRKDNKRR